MTRHRWLAALLASISLHVQAAGETDWLTLARGALPVSVGGDADGLRVGNDQALAVIDGNPVAFVVTPKPGGADTEVSFTWVLPASTSFTGFAVPGVGETPSPSQTFFGEVEILGSATAADSGFRRLAGMRLQLPGAPGERSEVSAEDPTPVRWVRLVLRGGLDVQREATFFEFTELMGFGEQDPVPLSQAFSGQWKARGVLIGLNQEGPLVTGCYDRSGDLEGAVTGNVLTATGVDRDDGVRSLFVMTADADGQLTGVRSTNGAPFRSFAAPPAPAGTDTGCDRPASTTLGCGSVVYGLSFGFDSAVLGQDSAPVLDALLEGLSATPGSAVSIEGHTSSEGDEQYNQSLSERRARAVVEALTRRGLAADRLSATGHGESMPIASNDDEAGRSLNRRVEVVCATP